MSKPINEPFSLGLEGEQWMGEMPCLCIPVEGGKRAILVFKDTDDKYLILSAESNTVETNLLMAASVVEDMRNHLNATAKEVSQQAAGGNANDGLERAARNEDIELPRK